MDRTTPTHGGARPALAGQPADRGQRMTLYVATDHVRSLRALGDGNVSLGLRRLMESVAADAADQAAQKEHTHERQ